MAKNGDNNPKGNHANPGDDQDFWEQLLAAAQTEAARRLNVTSVQDHFRKGNTLLDTYRIDSDRIDGGMGSVWKVCHMGWNVDLAMKRPKPDLFANETAKSNFIIECQAWIELGLHPNIVSCYYVREIEDVPTIFSEWMENGSLENRIKDGTLYEGSDEEVHARLLDIAIQYARGLHYAHEKGLIHQDVKPDNVLLTNDWQAKAADFGLAKARVQLTVLEGEKTQFDDAGATHIAPSGGYTPAYCSMEQMDGRPLTRRTDIYSWAVSVMEMYCGSCPWSNGVVAGMGCRTYFYDSDNRVPMPVRLQDLLANCLEMEPDDRPHDFAVIEDELLRIYRQETGNSYPRPEPKAASDTADSLNNRALSYLDMGQDENAEKYWASALDKDPKHIDARFNRELYLVRSGKKWDHEAVTELSRYKAIRDAGLVEVLVRDNGGSLESVVRGEPRKNKYGYYSCYSFSDKDVFAFNGLYGRISDGISKRQLEILRLDLKTGMKLGSDSLEAVRNAVEDIKVDLTRDNVAVDEVNCLYAMILHDGGQLLPVIEVSGYYPKDTEKNEYHSYFFLCLYDMNKKVLTKTPKLVADLPFWGTIKKPVIRPDGSQIMLQFCKTMEMKTIMNYSCQVDIPSFRAELKSEFQFICYLPENRCLFRGRNEKRKMALFVMEPDRTLREVFKFSRAIEKAYEFGDDGVPVLCYQYTNGEIFRVDEKYRKIPINRLPLSSSNTFYPLKYDSEHGLLYLHGDGKLEIWDFSREKLCTLPMPSKTSPIDTKGISYDENQRILLVSSFGSFCTWASVYLPVPRPKMAQWRLSHIISAEKRMDEESRLAYLIIRFKVSWSSGDYEQAVDIYRECCLIPGFFGSRNSFDMAGKLELVAEKQKLLTLRLDRNTSKPPSFSVLENYCDEKYSIPLNSDKDHYSLSDGRYALYSAGKPNRGVRFFTADGKMVSKVDLPDDTQYIAVRDEFIYAVREQMACDIYDMDGHFVKNLCGKDESVPWSSWEKRWLSIYDIDPEGKYLLYADKNSVCQRDLFTGNTIRMKVTAKHLFHYLDNGTVITPGYGRFLGNNNHLYTTFILMERYSRETGEKLPDVTMMVNTCKSPECKLYVNGKRDKVCILLHYGYYGDNPEKPDEIRVYNSDGELLCQRESDGEVKSVLMFDEDRFIAFLREIKNGSNELCVLDIIENDIVFVEKVPKPDYLSFFPDGREIYLHYNSYQVGVYRLEYDYQMK